VARAEGGDGGAASVDAAAGLMAVHACVRDAVGILALARSHGTTPNARSYNALVRLWAVAAGAGMGDAAVDRAVAVVEEMRAAGVAPDCVVYNTVIHACARAAAAGRGGGVARALAVVDLIRAEGLQPDAVSYTVPPPPSRTNWTRLVPPPVLTGRVASLLPY
jgi:acetyl esterase/lipase